MKGNSVVAKLSLYMYVIFGVEHAVIHLNHPW